MATCRDLRPHQVQPEQLASWIHGHRQIENSLHRVRDVTYAEDTSQVRTGHAPQVVASLRDFVISAHCLVGATNIGVALRRCARNSARALAILESGEACVSAAVDEQFQSVDHAGFVGCQVDGCPGDIVGVADLA